MKTMKKDGFTILEIMIAVTIIGFLAGLAIPAFMKTRTTAQRTRCIDNLRQIANYKEMWAMESFANTGTAVDESDIAPFFKTGLPECPGGGEYDYTEVGSPPLCSLPEEYGHVFE